MDKIEESIQADLLPFTDPLTEYVCEAEEGSVTVQCTIKGNARAFIFEIDRGLKINSVCVFRGHRKNAKDFTKNDEIALFRSYDAFLSSDFIADMYSLAKTIQRIENDCLTGNAFYIETNGVVESEKTPAPLIELLKHNSDRQDLSRAETKFVIMTGGAGAGKSTTISVLAARQAADFVGQKAKHIFIPIKLQMRNLARLNDAIAATLQDYRAAFPYRALPTLVRNGLVVPVLDGFDELTAHGRGYDDPMDALGGFLEELNGNGVVIAASRSGAVVRYLAGNSVPLHVQTLPWGAEQIGEYVGRFAKANKLSEKESRSLSNKMEKAFPVRYDFLRGIPFFVAHFADLLSKKIPFSNNESGSFLRQVLLCLANRESRDKLNDPNTNKPIVAPEQVEGILSEFAHRMYSLGVNTLTIKEGQELCQLSCEAMGLPPNITSFLVKRTSSMPLMHTDEDNPEIITFAHEILRDYYIGKNLAERMRSCDPYTFKTIFSYGEINREIAESIVETLFSGDGGHSVDLNKIVGCIGAMGKDDNTSGKWLRIGGGRLVWAILSRCFHIQGECPAIMVSHVQFDGDDFSSIPIKNIGFEDVVFQKNNFGKTKWRNCKAKGVKFFDLTVNPEAMIELQGFNPSRDIYGIRPSVENDYEYAPAQAKGLWSKCFTAAFERSPVDEDRMNKALDLFDVLKKFRAGIFRPSHRDRNNVGLLKVLDLMAEHKVARRMGAGGKPFGTYAQDKGGNPVPQAYILKYELAEFALAVAEDSSPHPNLQAFIRDFMAYGRGA